MKVFVLLAIVCSFWTASAIPHWVKAGDECKATITNLAYDGKKQLVASFTVPTECAATSFNVKCVVGDGEPIESPALPGNVGIITLEEPIICEDVQVSIVALDETDGSRVESDPSPVVLYLPEIEKVTIDQTDEHLVFTYKKMDDKFISECKAQFLISGLTADGNDIECRNGGCEVPTAELELNACHLYTITVTAKVEDDVIIGNVEKLDYYYKLQAVDNPTITTDDGTVIIFNPLTDVSPDCVNVRYKVVEKSGSCFASTFSVMTEYGADDEVPQNGIARTAEITKKPTAVEDLTAEISGDNVLLRWNPPFGGDRCGLVYHGTSEGKTVFEDIHATTTTITNVQVADCEFKTISVFAKFEDIDSEEANIDIPGALGKVENLTCKSDVEGNVSCTWDEPAECQANENEVKYNVMYYDGNNVIQRDKIDNIFPFEYHMECASDSWFTVTPVLGDNGTGDIEEQTVTCSAS